MMCHKGKMCAGVKKVKKRAVVDGTTAFFFTYKLITKNEFIYSAMPLTALARRETFLAKLFL